MRNALYIQSGGPTAVINCSAAGVIRECQELLEKGDKLYASLHGIDGPVSSISTQQECYPQPGTLDGPGCGDHDSGDERKLDFHVLEDADEAREDGVDESDGKEE